MANETNQYFINLRDLMEMMGKTNESVSPLFADLRQAIDDNKLDKMSDAEFKNIKAEFIDASDNYLAGIELINKAKPPVKLMGVNLNLIKYYQEYANATKAMSDSLDENKKAINMDAFTKSEDAQDQAIEKFNIALTKILAYR